jgi:hypothetical protein
MALPSAPLRFFNDGHFLLPPQAAFEQPEAVKGCCLLVSHCAQKWYWYRTQPPPPHSQSSVGFRLVQNTFDTLQCRSLD